MLHKGSCHCGRIAFEVEGDLTQAVDCNCSHCRRKETAAINVHCLENVDRSRLTVVPFDGRSL